VVSLVFQPLSGRVYVNLLEGKWWFFPVIFPALNLYFSLDLISI
jgi:hypothetical protein